MPDQIAHDLSKLPVPPNEAVVFFLSEIFFQLAVQNALTITMAQLDLGLKPEDLLGVIKANLSTIDAALR